MFRVLAFFVVTSSCRCLAAQATPLLVEQLDAPKNALGGQLTDYGQIYSTLTAGNLVRYYTDFSQCASALGDLPSNTGGQIDYFEALQLVPTNVSFMFIFSTEVVKVQPKIVGVWSMYQVNMTNDVVVNVAQVNPSTFAFLNTSISDCRINDNKTGSAHFYSTQSSPPPLLSTYNSVYSLLKSGFVVTYTINYHACASESPMDANGGGTIVLYEDIAENNVNVGIQFSARLLILPSKSEFNERSFTLYQNGTVIVEQMALFPNFMPVWQTTLVCQMNDGKSGGSVSFYSRGGGARGDKALHIDI